MPYFPKNRNVSRSENLTRFPYGQYIAGNICSLAFRRNSRFEIKLGVYVKFAKKCNNDFTQKSCQTATPISNLLRDVNIAIESIAWPVNVRSRFRTFQSLVTSVHGYTSSTVCRILRTWFAARMSICTI